jgi:hypothetical protein
MGVFPGGYSLNKGIFRFISTSKEKLSRGPNKKIHSTAPNIDQTAPQKIKILINQKSEIAKL